MADIPSGLGPWCVGVRVVVRRRLPGRTGPSGGPALTDLLGVMEDWGDRTLTVRGEDGTVTVMDRCDVVAGKPVPPRPPVRLRVPATEAQLRAADCWPAVEQARLGDWLLRASSGFSARANSALLAGEPDRPWDDALAEVRRFYAARDLPAWVQVLDGTEAAHRLDEAGWVAARPGQPGVELRLGGVARAQRTARGLLPPDPPAVALGDRVDEPWLAGDARALASREVAQAVLQGPDEVVFAGVRDRSGSVVAKGRAALSTRGDVWLGLSDLWVAPTLRGGGLGTRVVHALLGWGAERGAGTVCLQVRLDNLEAAAFYDRLGIVGHHTYRYLAPPLEVTDP